MGGTRRCRAGCDSGTPVANRPCPNARADSSRHKARWFGLCRHSLLPCTHLHRVISSPSVSPTRIHLSSKHRAKEEEKPQKLLQDQSPPARDSSPGFHSTRDYPNAKLVCIMSSNNRFPSPSNKAVGEKKYSFSMSLPSLKEKGQDCLQILESAIISMLQSDQY